jgi:hypothetical protein
MLVIDKYLTIFNLSDLNNINNNNKKKKKNILFLRGASCCVKLIQFSHVPANATEIIFLFYYNLLPHVSDPTGHPQVEHMWHC